MAATYDLIRDFPGGDSLLNQTPYWVVGIVRFANQITYDPIKNDPTGDRSISISDNFAIEELDPLVLTSEVSQVQISSAKESHITTIALSLLPYKNFAAQIRPGDWVLACMVNSETKGLEIADRMRRRQPINRWSDGLKFVGRAGEPREIVSMDPNGTPNTMYSLQGFGFGELDSQLYYHPQLVKNQSTPVAMAEFGLFINDITNGTDGSVQQGTVEINLVIPKILSVVFGKGAWSNAVGGAESTASPNAKYLLPVTVGRWLGIDTQTYNDILRPMIGLHHYQTVHGSRSDSTQSPWSLFQPDGLTIDNGTLKTGTPLVGWFPLAPPASQGTVWSMLSGFQNAPLNEMYTTLRATQDGNILPHLIVRQLPYSTNAAKAIVADFKAQAQADEQASLIAEQNGVIANGSIDKETGELAWNRAVSHADATDFLELPRWKIHPSMIYQSNLGRSESMRVNFVHVAATGYGVLTDEVGGFVRAPPVRDSLDIKRSGLKPYMASTNSTLRDLQRAPGLWRDLMADILMCQHLTLNGSVVCVGIQAPIAVGDNAEYNGIVYHIESINHVASIQSSGQRSFQTILSISHGVYDKEGKGMATDRSDRFPGVKEDQTDLGFNLRNITSER
jgi:hypothetical protein